MAFDGAGNFIRLYNWTTDFNNGIDIMAARMDAEDSGFATGLSNCITRDGQGKPSATISWNSQRLSNLALPTSANDAANATFTGYVGWGGTAGGTANALTVSITPAPGSIVAGMRVRFIAASQNTAAATLSVNGSTPTTIVRSNGVNVGWGDLEAGQLYEVQWDGTRWRLIGLTTTQAATGFGSIQSVASASTTDIATSNSHFILVTGTTSINSFGSSASTVEPLYLVLFQGIVTLNQGSNMLLPGGVNLTTDAGGLALAQYNGSGVWQVIKYWA